MFRNITIRTNILANFLFVVAVVAAGLLTVQYYFSRQLAMEATEKTFRQLAGKVTVALQGRDTLAKETLSLIEGYPGLKTPPTFAPQGELLRRLSIPMQRNPSVYAVYTGYGNGDLFEVVNLKSSPKLLQRYQAPPSARWLVIKVLDGPKGRVRRFDFFDDAYTLLSSRENSSDYSAKVRPWYRQAQRSKAAVRSDPYMFSNLQAPGITFSKRLADGTTVLALDITLQTLRGLFRQLKFSRDSEISLIGRDGTVMISSENGHAALNTLLAGANFERHAGSIVQFERDGRPWLAMLLPLSIEAGETTWMGFSVDEATMLRPYLEKIYLEIGVGVALLVLLLPLVLYTTGRIVKPIKLLTDETVKIKARHFDAVKPVRTNIIELRALSDSLVSMSCSIREYQEAQKAMMDSFIKIIADAIDTKSPYTGGHCKRVPVIAMMLAQAASDKTEGLFASFSFEGQDAWEEFERGAWLHDCGKITTPEYVVDKATKLETIYNRIHEIRTRFEVIRRDVEIAYYERLAAGEDKAALDAWKAREHETLQEEFAFIATANMGGEFMSEELKARVRAIGQRKWLRHFDDRLGLSDSELMRYEGVPERPAPAWEPLLDDKPEHRVARVNFDAEAYHAQGFKTPVPELLYNYGELYNLCVEKGTLTEEERFKINEHVIMSIKMLELLPLPENMKRIPEYAGTHHETLDGRGYPRQLTVAELSVQARITAIADIFEALTASDRPYKKAKTLSQTLEIMARMVEERHIDGDLFALFLRSGIPQRYAEQYLKPEQIDAIDIEALLSAKG
jgi:HD-GYP domain-containing protein (c-di-GMP phosphodiesterase class II)